MQDRQSECEAEIEERRREDIRAYVSSLIYAARERFDATVGKTKDT